jgi:integrase
MATTKRKSKGNTSTDNHEILGGKAQIYRVAKSGDVYQFKMWVKEEQKYLRKSLRTRDLETAKSRAEDKYLKTYSDVSGGRKIFGMSLGELVTEFIAWRADDVDAGIITKGRLGTIKSQFKHVTNFKSEKLKISEFDRNSFYDYGVWRKKNFIGTQSVTIKGEQSTINQMIDYAYRKGYAHFARFEFRKITITKDKIGRRSVFTLEEYDDLWRFMRTYSSKTHCADEALRNERWMVRDAVLIASNSMLRVGELWQLRWSDIVGIKTIYDEQEKAVHLVTINVRAEICKTRTSREVVCRGGQFFERLKERSEFTGPNDYIFSSATDGTKRMSRTKWYSHWQSLMEGIGIEDYTERKLTWYSLRHFAITCRIRSGVSYLDISHLAGTSVANIESVYGHWDTSMKEASAMKNFALKADGIDVR